MVNVHALHWDLLHLSPMEKPLKKLLLKSMDRAGESFDVRREIELW